MKLFTSLLLLLTLSFSVSAAGERPTSESKSTAVVLEEIADDERADITVDAKGVVCAFCAQGLKKAFAEEGSIRGIRFNYSFNKIELFLRPGKSLSDDVIKALVIESGYDVQSISR